MPCCLLNLDKISSMRSCRRRLLLIRAAPALPPVAPSMRPITPCPHLCITTAARGRARACSRIVNVSAHHLQRKSCEEALTGEGHSH